MNSLHSSYFTEVYFKRNTPKGKTLILDNKDYGLLRSHSDVS